MTLRPTMWAAAGALMLAGLIGAARPPSADAAPGCGPHRATIANVGRPTSALAWRAGVLDDTPVYARLPGRRRTQTLAQRLAG